MIAHLPWTLANIYQMWVCQVHTMGKVTDLDRELASSQQEGGVILDKIWEVVADKETELERE